jgi:hypothetical protein
MNKDFNVYKWRREHLAESVESFEGWLKQVRSKKGEKEGKSYEYVVTNVPKKLLSVVSNVIEKKYNIVVKDEYEDDERGVIYDLYLTNKV